MAPALTSSWELESFVFSEGHGVKGLSEMKLERLPKQYFQPQEELHSASDVVEEVSIPVIDMSNCDDDPKVAELICDAAEKWGFFQIVNHGVPLRVLEDVKNATYKFFGQPAEEKRKYLKENTPDHNVRFGTSFTPHVEKALEWKDFLSCFYVSDEEVKAYWPSVCRDQLMEYMNESEPVIKKLLDVLMKGLNVQTLDETKQSILMGSRRINLNYYPKCPDHELTVGVGRHSDVSTLTVLLQDEIGGLYVRKMETDSWIHVVPIKGALIINIGDALQIMSNGRYKSIEHRVIANGENNRISVPIFVNPKPSDVIGPLPEVLEGGDQAFYKQVLYSDYCRYFYSKRHNGKDTLEFARI